jgi:iron complex outermembrane receptor protein
MQVKRITICLALAFAHGAFAAETIETTLSEVKIIGSKAQPQLDLNNSSMSGTDITRQRASTSDTAKLLDGQPGVSLYGAGGVSSLPVIHGMADDRVRTKVDGMDLIASCPNHMNSPLSYIDPSNVGSVKVYAGITPVSVGGDSIGGSIVVDTPLPVFAAPGQNHLTKGEVGTFLRSNGNGKGANLSATYATESINLTYSGATAESGNYKAGGDFKTRTDTGVTGHTLPLDEVGSTAYKTRNHTLALAVKSGNHLVEAKLGFQDIPYELYSNQRMDMLDNTQHRLNLRYLGQLEWGTLEARAYHEKVDHYMDFGPDKQFLYTTGNTTQGMPMSTAGKTTGVSAKASIDVGLQAQLRIGAEYQSYQLADWWPAVIGSMGMGPNDFQNINDGKRDRTALFGELEKNLNQQWMTLLGLRYEQVKTNAGTVHGYNLSNFPTVGSPAGMMNQTSDAANFNNAVREKTDNNLDLTALARYTANANNDIEFGFARKVRSPNLYERYSWSTASMMSIMNNFVGDGNGYFGNINLKSEKAHTLSASFDWHGGEQEWEFKATPYYTRVTDYIDAVKTASFTANKFNILQYANQSARLYGLDLSGHMPLAQSGWGEFGLKGLLNYTNGKNIDTGDDLYNIMPLNVKLTFSQKLGSWDNSVELVAVSTKDNLSDVRNEIRTPGYSLINLRGSYSWKQARLDFGIENLFNKNYGLPLGGAYAGQGTTMSRNPANMPWGIPVPGMGRSINAGVTVKF